MGLSATDGIVEHHRGAGGGVFAVRLGSLILLGDGTAHLFFRRKYRMKKVAVIMGSASDLPVVRKAADTLRAFGVPCEVHVYSAHRTPD